MYNPLSGPLLTSVPDIFSLHSFSYQSNLFQTLPLSPPFTTPLRLPRAWDIWVRSCSWVQGLGAILVPSLTLSPPSGSDTTSDALQHLPRTAFLLPHAGCSAHSSEYPSLVPSSTARGTTATLVTLQQSWQNH